MTCPQVVQLKAVFPHGAGFVLAFEFMLSDLAEVVRHAQRPLTQAQVKSYLQMLLKGIAFCHANNIVHRVSAGASHCCRGVWGTKGLVVGQPLKKEQGDSILDQDCNPRGVGTWTDLG